MEMVVAYVHDCDAYQYGNSNGLGGLFHIVHLQCSERFYAFVNAMFYRRRRLKIHVWDAH